MTGATFKVVVVFEAREGGGLRAYSDDVPGLTLSSVDIDGLIADVPEALSVCLSHTLEAEVTVSPLAGLKDVLADRNIIPSVTGTPGRKEFVAYVH